MTQDLAVAAEKAGTKFILALFVDLRGKPCVSQPLKLEYMLAHHHLQQASVTKQDADLKRRTHIKNTRQKFADIRSHCEVCQSYTHANNANPGTYRPFPVPTYWTEVHVYRLH